MQPPHSEPMATDSSRLRWHVEPTGQWLASALDWVNRAANMALAAHGRFDLVLSGGATPEKLYRVLATQPYDWSRWHIWFGDERCLPPGDPQRNSRMAQTTWLDRVAIPAVNIHVIPAERGAAEAAARYRQELSGQPAFDLVLLGIGQDGHTASLFPGHAWGEQADSPDALPVFDAPKPPPQRVSLSAYRLSRAHCVLFLACGADKRPALAAWRRGDRIPASAIQPHAGVDLLIDADACPPGENA
jgi:6-phosphogluconolactonase